MPTDPERTKQLRERMWEHLESALAIADETQGGEQAFEEQALDHVRASALAMLDPNLEIFRNGKR
jgi:hypothetical protein